MVGAVRGGGGGGGKTIKINIGGANSFTLIIYCIICSFIDPLQNFGGWGTVAREAQCPALPK